MTDSDEEQISGAHHPHHSHKNNLKLFQNQRGVSEVLSPSPLVQNYSGDPHSLPLKYSHLHCSVAASQSCLQRPGPAQ